MGTIEYIFATTSPPNDNILWSSAQNDPPNPNFEPNTLIVGAIIRDAPAFTLFMDYDKPEGVAGDFNEVSHSIPDTQGGFRVIWTNILPPNIGQYQVRWRSSEFGDTTIPFTIGVDAPDDPPDDPPGDDGGPLPPPTTAEETVLFWTNLGYSPEQALKIIDWVRRNQQSPTDETITTILSGFDTSTGFWDEGGLGKWISYIPNIG